MIRKIDFKLCEWAKNIVEMPEKSFDINPLDINLAQIEFNMQKRIELEVPDYGSFAPVTEHYCSKDPTLNLSKVTLNCEHSSQDSTKEIRKLILTIENKIGKSVSYIIAEGKKRDILSTINDRHFFLYCKHIVLSFDIC